MPGWLRIFLSWLKRRKLTVILLIFTFIVSGFVVNFFQLLTLPLYWTNKQLFRKLNARIVYLHWCIIPWTLESWAEYDIRIFGHDDEVGRYGNKEHALVLINHRGDLDWMVGWVLIDRLGMLGGTKAVMKDIAKYIPGMGWSFMFMEYPRLKRDWARDHDRLNRSCQNLADYPINMLLCLFAEGTRFTEEKHRQSMEYARSKNKPVFRHHLFPRTKGFCFLVNNLRNTLGAVYDVTICYRGNQDLSVLGVVNAESSAADIAVRRFDMAEILRDNPDDEALADWLVNLYKEKDELVEYHNKHKKFPMPEVHINKPYWGDIIVAMWVCVCSIPVFLTTLYLAWFGYWIMLLLIVGVLCGADVLFQVIIRHTQTKVSSSSYGLKPPPPPGPRGNGTHLNSPSTSGPTPTDKKTN